MFRKSILVLANSTKNNERCIAGRELLLANGQTVLSGWVRPVSNHDDGELSISERVIAATLMEVGVGDIVEVSLGLQPHDPTQPENWVLWQSGDWADVGSNFVRPGLDQLEEDPGSLWLEPNVRNDRVSDNWLARNPPAQSLYVVRGTVVVVHLACDNHGKQTYRCEFGYRGQRYNLSLTDPEAQRKFHPQMPKPGANPVKLLLGSVRLCISLARSFRGYHYKVVATILEGL
jgi:hypothetical protein